MEYSHNFGSNFPNEIIPVGTKKDIDDTIKELIKLRTHTRDFSHE